MKALLVIAGSNGIIATIILIALALVSITGVFGWLIRLALRPDARWLQLAVVLGLLAIYFLIKLAMPVQAQRDGVQRLDHLYEVAYCVGALKTDPTPEAQALRERYAAYVAAHTKVPAAVKWTAGATAKGEREAASGQASERVGNCRKLD